MIVDRIAEILAGIVIAVVVRGTGRNILKLFGRHDESSKALDTVGAAFWFAVFVASYYAVRACMGR